MFSSSLRSANDNTSDDSLVEHIAFVKRNALLEQGYVMLYRRRGLGGIKKELKPIPFKPKKKKAAFAPVKEAQRSSVASP